MFCCNFGLIREAGRMAQCVCGCLFCMICGGPIMLIVGIVILVIPNTREKDVKDYNEAAAKFDAAPVNGWTGTIGGVTATKHTDNVVPSGETEDVDTFQSVYMASSISSQPNSVAYNLATVASTTVTVPGSTYSSVLSGSVRCRQSYCSSSKAANLCKDKYGSSATSSDTCNNDQYCSCQYTRSLQQYCIVATASGASYVMSSAYQSCFYPFSNRDTQQFTGNAAPGSVSFELRMDTDPFVIMQKITEGSMDFGITAGQQRTAGIALIIIGCIMIACLVLVGFGLYKLVKGTMDKRAEGQPAPQQQGHQEYSPQLPQPQPQYGNFQPQQQPAYGQPLSYAPQQQYQNNQPQPSYGQPPMNQPAYQSHQQPTYHNPV